MDLAELQQPAVLPIREVARRTGVNPVTLRAWERRYGLLEPERTGKGHRLYSEMDVQRIEEILTWLARGVAIGQVRPLLERHPAMLESEEYGRDSWSQLVQQTAAAVRGLAAGALQRQLEQLLASYPLPLLLDLWLVPLHKTLSRQSRFGNSVALSFFWQLMAEQLAITLRASRKSLQRGGGVSGKILLVSFPGGEQQAFAQLFCAALLAAGFDVVNLGADMALAELPFAEDKLGARGVICYSHNALPMAVFGSGLERAVRGLRVPLWLAGGFVDLQRRDLQRLVRGDNCKLLPADCTLALQQLRAQL